MKKLTLEEFQERLNKVVHPKEKLKAIYWGGDSKETKVICETCQTEYIKKGGLFLDKRKVSICKKCFPTQSNTLNISWQPPQGYKLIEEYKGMEHKILVQHEECGFVWAIKPTNLKYGKGCPKCFRHKSKGELKICQWLLEHNIEFNTQIPIKLEDHCLTIDFYLPKFDLYIEYNGEQHYKPIPHFGGQSKFEKQVFYDNLKEKYLGDRLLIISYLEFSEIENILESSTTIPKGSRKTSDRSFEVENSLILGNDMV